MPVRYGVPQGSVLGPLLFSVYVNDLPYFVNCKCEMFANDTSMYASDSDPCRLTKELQNNINKLINWTQLNHVSKCSKNEMYVCICETEKAKDEICF